MPLVHRDLKVRLAHKALLAQLLQRDTAMPVREVAGPTPVEAKLKVYVTNLNQQLIEVPMREVREGTAIYYLGEFRVAPPDTLMFTATVETAGEPKREVRFSQKFYK